MLTSAFAVPPRASPAAQLRHAAVTTQTPVVATHAASVTLSTLRTSSFSLARRSFASHAIPVPSMGDSISEGTLAEVLVDVGRGVAVDDIVAKIDTDKVCVDIRSTVAGRVAKWHAKVGDTVKVGAPLLEVEAGAAGTKATTTAAEKPAAPVQSPGEKPDADVGEKTPAPLAQSGTQAPQSMNPTDPHDSPVRVPLIAFRFGKRDAAGGAHGHAHRVGHQHQGNQTVEIVGADFLTANEAAAAAWDALPARYKRKPLKEAQLVQIELGGAPNYESKKKGARAEA